MDGHPPSGTGRGRPVPSPRRLSDKILVAFHHACDQGDHQVAKELLDLLEFMMSRQSAPSDRRRIAEGLVAAHERLWSIRHTVDTE